MNTTIAGKSSTDSSSVYEVCVFQLEYDSDGVQVWCKLCQIGWQDNNNKNITAQTSMYLYQFASLLFSYYIITKHPDIFFSK